MLRHPALHRLLRILCWGERAYIARPLLFGAGIWAGEALELGQEGQGFGGSLPACLFVRAQA